MLSRRPRSNTVVGVAIDGDVVRGVQLQRLLGQLKVEKTAEVELDPATTEHGRIVDGAALTDGLRRLWAAGDFSTKNVAFGIDGRDAMFRRLVLPLAASDDVQSAARYELAEYLPYALDEAVTSISEVGRNDHEIEVVARAVRVTTTERILGIVKDAGLRLTELTLTSTALGYVADDAGRGGSDAIVTVEGASTTILLRRNGRATVARVLSSGGGDRSAQVADEIADAIATVDRYRAGSAEQAATTDVRESRFRAAADEVAAAIRFELSERNGADAPASILLAGAYGEEEALHTSMAQTVEAPVELVASPSWWLVDEPFAPYIAAVGLAHHAVHVPQGGAERLDPPTELVRRAKRAELLVGALGALLVALLGSQIVLGARTTADNVASAAIDAEARADLFAGRLAALDDVAILALDVEDRRRLVDEALQDEIAWPRLLEQIASVIPEDTFFTGVSLRQPDPDQLDEDTTASFSGIALDQSGVARWLLAVAEVPGIEDVWLVQSTSSVYGDDELPVVNFIAEAELTTELRSDRALGHAGGDDA